jgi:murein DD-endopeptidase MepM/ murein hydrolase activator NlpD
MIIPGKYGSSKSILISKWLIFVIVILSISFTITILSFFNNYSSVKKQNIKSMEDIEALKERNITQQQELKSYEGIEEELKNKLEELKEIETQLRSRLSSKVETKTTSNITLASSHINFLEVDEEIKILYSLIDSYDKKMSDEKRIPNVLPCSGKISSYFGRRTNPVSRGRSETHHGIDIINSYKTQIKASADGVVEYAGWLSGYGYAVIINHQNGYTSVYGHNSKLLVKKSQFVTRGQPISLMGSTGRSTGTHVHFEIRLNGISINPLKITKGGNL